MSASTPDVQLLQTAASIENAAVTAYTRGMELPFMAETPAVLKSFAGKTKEQHSEHARAFNAAIVRLQGKNQDAANPELKKQIDAALPAMASPPELLDLLIRIETVAAHTFVAGTAALSDLEARKLVASVMGMSAQYAAMLSLFKALLPTPNLIALPPVLASLPAATGSTGFPTAFLATDQARPIDEGALK